MDDKAVLVEALRSNLPALLQGRVQWLVWRFEPNEDPAKKPRKVPYYASGRRRTGVQGSPADRGHLVGFAQALAELQAGTHAPDAAGWQGLGFAFLPGDGLIGVDIDGAIDPDTGEVSARCQAIVEACGSYTEYSPSGKGVHIIVQGHTKTFKDNRIGLEVFCERQFFTCTGRPWPGSVADVMPLADGVLRRLQATVAGSKQAARAPLPAPPAAAGGAGRGDVTTWLEQALGVLDSGAVSYDEWIGVGMALKSALGDAGLRLWDYWSSKGGERYPGPARIEAHWKSFAGADADGAMVIFKMARRGNRWRPPRAWHDAYGDAGSARPAAPATQPQAPPQGVSGAQPAAGVRAPASEAASTTTTGSAAEVSAAGGGGAPPDTGRDWRDSLLRSNGGKKDCRENVYLYLVHHPTLQGLVGYDEFAHRVMKLRPPPWESSPGEWSTNDDYLLGFWLAENERLVIKGEGTLIAGVAMAAFHNRYHPVKRYLSALPAWDGIERLPFWLSECLGATETTYTRLVGTWFLMGMVKRVQDPGCQMDYMVVLEGLQGKRKSTALRALVGNDEWFADTPIRIGDKDAMLSLAGKWLYEVGELDSFNKAEVTAVKQYVSSRIDRVREPFARRPTDRPRSGVFAGSTNQSEYFKDPTGARRFWPVACDGDINIEKLSEWRPQLFAEAMHNLASDDPEVRRCWPTREETDKYLVPEQERREIGDPWYEKLVVWLNSKQRYGDTTLDVCEVDSFTSYDLLTKALNVPSDRIDGSRQMSTRVGIAMHKLGWEKRRDAGGARLWRYCRPAAKAEVGHE